VYGEEGGVIVLSTVFEPEEEICKNAKKNSISTKHKNILCFMIKIPKKLKG